MESRIGLLPNLIREFVKNKLPKFCGAIFSSGKAKNTGIAVVTASRQVFLTFTKWCEAEKINNLFNVVNRLRTGGYAFACAFCASGHKPTRRLFNAVRGKKNEVKLCVLLFPHY